MLPVNFHISGNYPFEMPQGPNVPVPSSEIPEGPDLASEGSLEPKNPLPSSLAAPEPKAHESLLHSEVVSKIAEPSQEEAVGAYYQLKPIQAEGPCPREQLENKRAPDSGGQPCHDFQVKPLPVLFCDSPMPLGAVQGIPQIWNQAIASINELSKAPQQNSISPQEKAKLKSLALIETYWNEFNGGISDEAKSRIISNCLKLVACVSLKDAPMIHDHAIRMMATSGLKPGGVNGGFDFASFAQNCLTKKKYFIENTITQQDYEREFMRARITKNDAAARTQIMSCLFQMVDVDNTAPTSVQASSFYEAAKRMAQVRGISPGMQEQLDLFHSIVQLRKKLEESSFTCASTPSLPSASQLDSRNHPLTRPVWESFELAKTPQERYTIIANSFRFALCSPLKEALLSYQAANEMTKIAKTLQSVFSDAKVNQLKNLADVLLENRKIWAETDQIPTVADFRRKFDYHRSKGEDNYAKNQILDCLDRMMDIDKAAPTLREAQIFYDAALKMATIRGISEGMKNQLKIWSDLLEDRKKHEENKKMLSTGFVTPMPSGNSPSVGVATSSPGNLSSAGNPPSAAQKVPNLSQFQGVVNTDDLEKVVVPAPAKNLEEGMVPATTQVSSSSLSSMTKEPAGPDLSQHQLFGARTPMPSSKPHAAAPKVLDLHEYQAVVDTDEMAG